MGEKVVGDIKGACYDKTIRIIYGTFGLKYFLNYYEAQ